MLALPELDGPGAEAIRAAAGRFRAAIQRCPRHLLPVTLHAFPRGACGDATILLGEFLAAEGFGTFDYVAGERFGPHYQSHAWLERDGLIVDITADQFAGAKEPVIVSRENRWHRRFRRDVRHPARIDVYTDSHTSAMLRTVYAAIRSVLGKSERPMA